MAKIGSLTLTGASGNKYQFNVFPVGTPFKSVPAVYYVSMRTEKLDGTGTHSEIYIGQTDDISSRFDDHHKALCFARYDANCISVHQEANPNLRLTIESDLISAYDPPCNG